MLLARWIARSDARAVVSIQNNISQVTRDSSDFRIRIIPLLARRLFPRADGIAAVSSGVADDFSRRVGIRRDRIQVIYNPVVTPELHDRAREVPRHSWFSEPAVPIIIAVGRLNRQKDFETLIRAFHRVLRKRQARLVILGEGEERASLEALVSELGLEDSVSLPGFFDNPFACMARASVFVLSSAWEGLPTVLIEALALGVPVVATNCESGPDEILEGGRLGQLVPVGDSAALAEAVLSRLEEEVDRDSLRERAKDFSLDEIPDQFLEIMLPDRHHEDHERNLPSRG
jgi:glycosyltransferase involved in cell wall biosynthesis